MFLAKLYVFVLTVNMIYGREIIINSDERKENALDSYQKHNQHKPRVRESLNAFVTKSSGFCCLHHGRTGSRRWSSVRRKMKRDTNVVTTIDEDIMKMDAPHLIDRLIHNDFLPQHITSQLQSILRNITEYKRNGMYRNRDAPYATSTVYEETRSTVISLHNDSADLEDVKERFKRLYPIGLWKEHGWFEDDYLHLINIHWLQFPPQPKAAHYAMALTYSTIAFCGFIGNIMVIFMFFKCQSLRTPANILVVNLAISDFLMISKTPLFIYNSFYLGPATGQIGCIIYGFFGGLTGTVSIGTLAAIAFDRYSVVVYPLEPLRSLTKLRAKISVLAVWIYGCFFAFIPVMDIGLGRYVPEGFLTSCSFDYLSEDRRHKIFILSFFLAAWALPLAIISFCYIKILRAVITTRSTLSKTGSVSSRHCSDKEKRKSELKLAGIVIAVIALFFAAWTPYSIVALLGISGYKDFIHPLTSMIPAICCKVASCIDPFVYILSHPKFRQECINLLLTKEKRRKRSTMRLRHSTLQQRHIHQSRDVTSEDDVEVVEMAKLPFIEDSKVSSSEATDGSSSKKSKNLSSIVPMVMPINTISLHVSGLPVDNLPKTAEENKQLQPPSWFAKPKFVHRDPSIKRVVQSIRRHKSDNALPT